MSAAALSHGLEKAELLVVEWIKAAGLERRMRTRRTFNSRNIRV
jgi:hypothetical protein